MRRRIDWSKWGLGVFFVLFLAFLYAPMVLMAILSLQGPFGSPTCSPASAPSPLRSKGAYWPPRRAAKSSSL